MAESMLDTSNLGIAKGREGGYACVAPAGTDPTPFLDMKKTRLGKRKKKYAAIYNRYVYGYLKSPVYRLLMASLPNQIIKTMEDTVTTIKK